MGIRKGEGSFLAIFETTDISQVYRENRLGDFNSTCISFNPHPLMSTICSLGSERLQPVGAGVLAPSTPIVPVRCVDLHICIPANLAYTAYFHVLKILLSSTQLISSF